MVYKCLILKMFMINGFTLHFVIVKKLNKKKQRHKI